MMRFGPARHNGLRFTRAERSERTIAGASVTEWRSVQRLLGTIIRAQYGNANNLSHRTPVVS